MQLEIITPEAEVFKGNAKAVQLPGKDGLFQILSNHAPLISTLTEGTVKIDLNESYKRHENLSKKIETDKNDEQVLYLPITGGVVEVQNDKVILLAD